MWIHIFTRDLRIEDNLAINEIPSKDVAGVFIFTPTQISKNKLFSSASFQFMCESLMDLDRKIPLHPFYGEHKEVLGKILKKDIEGVSMIKDYTPYAVKREGIIKGICDKAGIKFQSIDDIYLHPPGSILNKSKKTFQKFTPFYELARTVDVAKPTTSKKKWYGGSFESETTVKHMLDKLKYNEFVIPGGRTEAMKIFRGWTGSEYAKDHDVPSIQTSRLSAHNHYGTVSIREVYHHYRERHEFIRQLFWRDFYGHIVANFEGLYGEDPYEFKGKGHWSRDVAKFNKWTRGETGVDIVDAGMKQLLKEGYIHNRVRLIVSSYLVKELGIYWRWGERWFAKNLVDYDFTQNFSNWIWVSSLLPFASAPFRTFAPARQEKEFDPERIYINKYLNNE
jgi:deoxyribodipyrimidine photo-lyase